jgi:hypothetical protein
MLAKKKKRSSPLLALNTHASERWSVRSIAATNQRGFDYYALKDAAMAGDAECGFMLWDGKSKGTLFNIRRLLAAGKPVLVYLATDHTCHTIRHEAELALVVAPPSSVHGSNAPAVIRPVKVHSFHVSGGSWLTPSRRRPSAKNDGGRLSRNWADAR